MSKINKTLLIVVLCLIFIGQGIASSVMFYKMDMKTMSGAKQHVHSAMMSDSSMSGHIMASNEQATDCCATECQCLVTGCSSVFALSKELNTNIIIDSPDKILPIKLLISQQVFPSLYRPPIVT